MRRRGTRRDRHRRGEPNGAGLGGVGLQRELIVSDEHQADGKGGVAAVRVVPVAERIDGLARQVLRLVEDDGQFGKGLSLILSLLRLDRVGAGPLADGAEKRVAKIPDVAGRMQGWQVAQAPQTLQGMLEHQHLSGVLARDFHDGDGVKVLRTKGVYRGGFPDPWGG